jgi:hypothetical protein
MNWSSIFGGAFLILGFGFFFVLLGNVIGLTVVNSISANSSGPLKVWSWIYTTVTLISTYFLGSYFSTRSGRSNSPSSGVVNGLVSWGLATTILLLGGAIGSVGIRILLAGLAPNSLNWLAICIVGLGGMAAAGAGVLGKYSKHHMGTTKD